MRLEPLGVVRRFGYPGHRQLGSTPWARRAGVVVAAFVTAVCGVSGCVTERVRPREPVRLPGTVTLPHATFSAAVEAYGDAAAGGWDEGECRGVAERFVDISSSVAGGLAPALFNAGLAWSHCDADRAREQYEAADAAARAECDECSGHAPSLLRLGSAAYHAGEVARARQLFDRAREADRRSADAYHNLGLLRREAGDFAAAQRDLRRALAVDSDHLEAYTQMALLYLDLGEDNPQMLDITELVCQQATARAREVGADPERVAPIHNTWGLARILRGDVVGAVEQFDRARELDPSLFEAHMNSGAVNLSFRGYQAAEEAFRAALGLHPDSYDAQVSLGAALRGLSRFDEARAAYERARGFDPSRPEAYYNLGVLLQDYLLSVAGGMEEQIELLGEARRVYERFIESCESAPERCVRRGSGGETEDMRGAASRRIDACDETEDGLREAMAPSSS